MSGTPDNRLESVFVPRAQGLYIWCPELGVGTVGTALYPFMARTQGSGRLVAPL